jgi:hypothetical protein
VPKLLIAALPVSATPVLAADSPDVARWRENSISQLN